MKGTTIPNVTVNMIPPVTEFSPVDGRQYKIQYSYDSSQMILSIHNRSEHAIPGSFRQLKLELVAEWVYRMGHYALIGKVINTADTNIDIDDIDSALMILINGDRTFFTYFPWLLEAPIYIQYKESDDKLVTSYFGSPRRYRLKEKKEFVV